MTERAHAEWYAWAKRNLSGDSRICHAAAETAVAAEAGGASREDAIRAARAAIATGGHAAGPASAPRVRAYAEWFDWARRELGGLAEQQHAAAGAALAHLEAGHGSEVAGAAARAAFAGGPAAAAHVPPVHVPPAAQIQSASEWGPAPVPPAVAPRPPAVTYAGFWRRVAANLVDALVLGVANLLLGFAAGLAAAGSGVDVSSDGRVQALLDVVAAALNLFYFAGCESSALQATPGKSLLRIRVTDLEGRRLSPARALGRNAAKYLSSLTLGIGYLMVAWTRRKQGLHDMVAGTLVVRA